MLTRASIVLAIFTSAGAHATQYEVSAWVSKDITTSSKIRLQLNTRNVPKVHISAYRVDGEEWLKRAHSDSQKPTTIGRPIQQWDTAVAEPNRFRNSTDEYFSRQINLPSLPPGVYRLDVSGGNKTASAVVNVTNLAVILKHSPTKTLVWVTDALSGAVVKNARINQYSSDGTLQGTHRTGIDGVVVTNLRPSFVSFVIRRGNDLAGVSSDIGNPDYRLVAHFQTDRPIYRPGQTVFFKSILRRTLGQGYQVPIGSKCKIELRDPKNNPIDEVSLVTSQFGTVDGKFDIPSEGMTGAYTIVLTNETDTAYETFTVAEYRKPEFKVEIAPAKKRYLSGQSLDFDLNASYYFGAPLQQASVHYSVRRSGIPFYRSDPTETWFYGGDGNLYPRDTYSSQPFVAEDTVFTDARGHVSIKVPSDPRLGDENYTVSCTVEDANRRQISAGASVPVYAASIRIGLRSDVRYGTLGGLVPVIISAADLDGKPVSANVKLRLTKPEWDEKSGKMVERTLTESTASVTKTGTTKFNVPALEDNNLILYASADDGTGRTAKAQLGIWVAGKFVRSPRRERPQPNVEVKLDRRVFQPGDIAHALISTNNPGNPVLVVIEGGDIWKYIVIQNSKPNQVYDVVATTNMSPNGYVTAQQWDHGQLISSNEILPIPDPDKALNVDVRPNRTDYRPGETASYTVRTTTRSGVPVAAEVAFSVVDEAIYALSPDVTSDIYRHYWGQRQNFVQTVMSAPEEMSGGAYQRVSTVAPLRQRFEDTAFWNAIVRTDSLGLAKVTVEIPGNLTTWRATARAVTNQTSVGSSVSSVVANRSTMLRLSPPRQMVAGDRLTLIGMVDNRSDKAHEFEVSLVADGITLSEPTRRRILVGAKRQGKIEWKIEAARTDIKGQAILTGQAVALDVDETVRADFSDAVEAKFPIVPDGIREREIVGGTVSNLAFARLNLPSDRLEPGTLVKIEVSGGVRTKMQTVAEGLLKSSRWGTIQAAGQLEAAAALGIDSRSTDVRESLALLSRVGRSDGWGWWENAPSDAAITARVLSALATARSAKLVPYDSLLTQAQRAANELYGRTNLWEHRALLTAALIQSGDPSANNKIEETLRRGQKMSPFARLRLAEAMANSHRKEALELAHTAIKDFSVGPDSAFVPAGYGIGWTASNFETTAQAVATLVALQLDSETQHKLVRWLVQPQSNYWRSIEDDSTMVHSLASYTRTHPDPNRVGNVEILVNGSPVETTTSRVGDSVFATIPRVLLKSGANKFELRRSESGEASFSIDASIVRHATGESLKGVRMIRRFEIRNDAGIWVPINRPIHPVEPVRCTSVVWGDDIPDALRIVEPTPSGFEFVDGENGSSARQEIRDGAVVHFLINNGNPQIFRYYIRAESEGNLSVLPATAEYIRRPADRGQSSGDRLEVKIEK